MDIWLHGRVVEELEKSGGKVSEALRDDPLEAGTALDPTRTPPRLRRGHAPAWKGAGPQLARGPVSSGSAAGQGA
jgi:hypothetical protein